MRILIADDDNVFRFALEKLLNKWGYEVFAARDGTEAWEIMAGEDAPSLALLDWMMPGKSGAEVCREIRKRNPEPYVYVIFLTGKADKQDTINGLAAGADDYLVKPFDSEELKARLLAGERIIGLQHELLSARKDLEFQAAHDPLTGLWNRKAIMEHFRGELVRSQRRKTPLAVIMADLDHFKKINDTFGTWRATRCCGRRRIECNCRCGPMTASGDTGERNFWWWRRRRTRIQPSSLRKGCGSR